MIAPHDPTQAPLEPASFTHSHYLRTLQAYISAGYQIVSFREYLEKKPNGKVLVLRHDIDLDLEVAHRMALLDHQAGARSTWFIRLHSRGYSPLNLDNVKILKALKKMGHEVALHYEPTFALAIGEDVYEYADRQKAIFEAIIGEPIVGLAPHEPARAGYPNLIDNLVDRWGLKYHAYDARFTKEMKYISDSSARWREGCFSTWINKVERLQVLVHPFWWYSEIPQETY